MKTTRLFTLILTGGLMLAHAPAALAQTWEQLSNDEQKVLHPLRIKWHELSPAQKQSWLKRVPELKTMPADKLDQAHSRMAEWGALSPQQRQQVEQRVKSSATNDPQQRAQLWRSFVNQ